jgi:hypothetical protein
VTFKTTIQFSALVPGALLSRIEFRMLPEYYRQLTIAVETTS